MSAVELMDCADEPIHIPGSIQPHGILVALDPQRRVEIVSQNAPELLGRPLDAILGVELEALIGAAGVAKVYRHLDQDLGRPRNPLRLQLQQDFYNGIVHRNPQGRVILELERAHLETWDDFRSVFQRVCGVLDDLRRVESLDALCQRVTAEVRRLTGFDRVVTYRFEDAGQDADGGHGEVVAEERREGLGSYLGWRFPASDIPPQARALYVKSWLRLVADAREVPTPLAARPSSVEPLDLSYSTLRSLSPIHCQYLQNMGVRSSLSISLLQGQRLWGLVACHHEDPKTLPFEVRSVCEMLGQVVSMQVDLLERRTAQQRLASRRSLHPELLEAMTRGNDYAEGVESGLPVLGRLIRSSGVAAVVGNRLVAHGDVPSEDVVRRLAADLRPNASTPESNGVWGTDGLVEHAPWLSDVVEVPPAGAMVLALRSAPTDCVLWFREERLHRVTWGGNPHQPKADRLTPRTSFDAWVQTVRGRSEPWASWEEEAAREVHERLLALAERLTTQAAERLAELNRLNVKLGALNQRLVRNNRRLGEFARVVSHDLKAPLRNVATIASWLQEDYHASLDDQGREHLDLLTERVRRMEQMIEGILDYSRSGAHDTPLVEQDPIEVIAEVTRALEIPDRVSIEVQTDMPRVRYREVQLQQVFQNLIGNAVKAIEGPGAVRVSWRDREDHWEFAIEDTGRGIPTHALERIFEVFQRVEADMSPGTGIGLAIVKRIVEEHGGAVRAESHPGSGSAFRFTVLKQAQG